MKIIPREFVRGLFIGLALLISYQITFPAYAWEAKVNKNVTCEGWELTVDSNWDGHKGDVTIDPGYTGTWKKDSIDYAVVVYWKDVNGTVVDTWSKVGRLWKPENCVEPTPTPSPTNTPTPTIVVTATPTPTSTPTETPPSNPPSNPPSTPQCTDTIGDKICENYHVIRDGDLAVIKCQPTEGDNAHVYWKHVTSNQWEHALRDQKNTGYFEIRGLGLDDWTFGYQQAQGCTAGPIAIIVDDNSPRMFRWEGLVQQ